MCNSRQIQSMVQVERGAVSERVVCLQMCAEYCEVFCLKFGSVARPALEAVDREADPELLRALEVIGAHVAALVDMRLHAAIDSAREGQVRCLVALAVLPPLDPRIGVAV